MGKPILQKDWLIWCPLLYLNFKSFLEANSLSFIRYQCTLYDSGVLYSDSWNFYKLKNGNLIFRKNQFCRVWIIWSSLLYFNFESFMDPNSALFLRSQCILHDWGGFFPHLWNFYKIKRGDLIARGNHFAEILNYFVPPSVFDF